MPRGSRSRKKVNTSMSGFKELNKQIKEAEKKEAEKKKKKAKKK